VKKVPQWVIAPCWLFIILAIVAAYWMGIEVNGGNPTWGDETFTVRLSEESWGEFWNEIVNDVHPPLYFLLTKIENIIDPGDAGESARFFAILIFVMVLLICIPGLIESFYRTNDKADKFLVLAGILLASSAHLFLFGPMMRYYMLNAGFLLIATLILLESARDTGKAPSSPFSYGLLLFLSFATSYISAVIIPAHLIFILSRPRHVSRPLLKSLLWAVIASIPLIILMIYQARGMHHHSFSESVGFMIAFAARFGFTVYSFSIGEFIRPWDLWFSIPAIISVGYLLHLAWRLRSTTHGLLFWLILAISLPLGILALTLIGVGLEFSASRLTFIAPIFLFLIGIAPSADRNSKTENIIGVVAVIILIIVNLVSTVNYVRGTNFMQSTYVIPWSDIASDIIVPTPDTGKSTMLLYDDDTLLHWLNYEMSPDRRHNLYAYENSIDIFMDGEIGTVIAVYSPRNFNDSYVNRVIQNSFNEATVIFEQNYLIEDENSVRWKSMLLGREVYAVKKKLIVYNITR
jgi:hypothetical protein